MTYNRILIIGCCGSGKSTLAKKIHTITRLPLIHLDKIYYKPNWEKPAKSEWEAKVANSCATEKWIMDGNYINTLEMRANAADMIVYLDIGKWKCLYRAIKRSITSFKKQRSDMAENCSEKFDLQFYKYIFNFHQTTKPRIDNVLKLYPNKTIHILKTKKDIRQCIETIKRCNLC